MPFDRGYDIEKTQFPRKFSASSGESWIGIKWTGLWNTEIKLELCEVSEGVVKIISTTWIRELENRITGIELQKIEVWDFVKQSLK